MQYSSQHANPQTNSTTSSPWLRLENLFLFGSVFLELLLSSELLLILPLELLLFFLSPRDWLEEALKTTLLRTLDTLTQSCGPALDSVLIETLLLDKVLDEAFDVRSLPLEVAQWVVGWPHIGLLKEEARVFEGPIFRDFVFCACLEVLENAFEVFVFADEFEGSS
jgi:hypothetical protein